MVGQIRAGGGCVRRENCVKYLKTGWNRKEGRKNKNFKEGGKLGQGVGALKRTGAGTPLTNYAGGTLYPSTNYVISILVYWYRRPNSDNQKREIYISLH